MGKLVAIVILLAFTLGAALVAAGAAGLARTTPPTAVEAGFGWDDATPSPSPHP